MTGDVDTWCEATRGTSVQVFVHHPNFLRAHAGFCNSTQGQLYAAQAQLSMHVDFCSARQVVFYNDIQKKDNKMLVFVQQQYLFHKAKTIAVRAKQVRALTALRRDAGFGRRFAVNAAEKSIMKAFA